MFWALGLQLDQNDELRVGPANPTIVIGFMAHPNKSATQQR
jgi:hypothetical protein